RASHFMFSSILRDTVCKVCRMFSCTATLVLPSMSTSERNWITDSTTVGSSRAMTTMAKSRVFEDRLTRGHLRITQSIHANRKNLDGSRVKNCLGGAFPSGAALAYHAPRKDRSGVSHGTTRESRKYPIADDAAGRRARRRLHGAAARPDRLHGQERKGRPLSRPRQTVADGAARPVEKGRARQHSAPLPALLHHL